MKIRHEINIYNSTYGKPIVLLDTTKYSGTVTYYFEILIDSVQANTFDLVKVSDGSVAAAIALNPAGLKRTAFTPPAGATEYKCVGPSGSGESYIKSARIVIIQDTGENPLTASESQFEIGSYHGSATNTVSADLTYPKSWQYEPDKWDGTLSMFAEVVWLGTNTMYTVSFELYGYSLSGGSDLIVSLGTFTVVTTETRTRIALTHNTDGINGQIRPGYRYVLRAYTSNSMGTYSIFNGKIIVQQTGSDITKSQDQYLLANTLFAAGTANQNFLTSFDPAEWDGVANEYVHAVDASDNNTSVVDLRDASSNQLAGSIVTSPDNQGFSSAITMPATQILDVRATTNNGSLFASRIIVNILKQTADALPRRVLLIT